ncbi:YopX protein [Methanophagales archaeon]|nr:YopX protein [Methanophagales archaeon]
MTEKTFRAFFDGEMLHNAARVGNALFWNDGKGFDLLAFKQQDPVILMQNTGLRDVNNMEIYEGDNVAQFDFVDPWYRRVVVFHLGAFGYEHPDNGFIAYATNYHFHWQNGQSNLIQVIGNIHENPELVKRPSGVQENSASSL